MEESNSQSTAPSRIGPSSCQQLLGPHSQLSYKLGSLLWVSRGIIFGFILNIRALDAFGNSHVALPPAVLHRSLPELLFKKCRIHMVLKLVEPGSAEEGPNYFFLGRFMTDSTGQFYGPYAPEPTKQKQTTPGFGLSRSWSLQPATASRFRGPKELKMMLRDYSQHRFKTEADSERGALVQVQWENFHNSVISLGILFCFNYSRTTRNQ